MIFIHDMCTNFIDNYFAYIWGGYLNKRGIGFIYEHNRGHNIENDILKKDGSFIRCGTMYEIFEDSIYDIDLAIETAKNLGYKRIILLGHSYGCNKVIYYYYKKIPNILGIILASAPDMIGIHYLLEPSYKELLKEAKANIENGEPNKLLSKEIEDYMYMSSKTYFNWYNEKTNLNNLPVISNSKHWNQFANINVPILTFSGSNEEDYYLKLNLLKSNASKCENFKYNLIDDTNHFYNGKEEETANIIYEWINNLFM